MKNKFEVKYSLELTIDEMQELGSFINDTFNDNFTPTEESCEIALTVAKRLSKGFDGLVEIHDRFKKFE